ncbi:hypothetical protein [Lysobacter gummosus]
MRPSAARARPWCCAVRSRSPIAFERRHRARRRAEPIALTAG